MHLLLWRHAEAEDGTDDLARRLTDRGQRQARAMAQWIKRHGPPNLRVMVSPAVRAQQTAKALKVSFETVRGLAPAATAQDLLASFEWHLDEAHESAFMLVGHQPALGELAALLLSGSTAPWTIKKGGVWWLTRRLRDGKAQIILNAVMVPGLIDHDNGLAAV